MQTFKPVIRWWSLVNMRLLAHYAETLEVYEDRLLYRKGILSKSEVVIPFARITNYADEQNLFDRLFGISNFQVETAGSTITPELNLIGYPSQLRQVLARAVESKGA